MGGSANDKLSKWLNGMSDIAEHKKLQRVVERDTVITNLIKVCGEKSEDINLDICSTRDIEVATEYIKLGFGYDLAFKYAVDYGLIGLDMIRDLSKDYGFSLKG